MIGFRVISIFGLALSICSPVMIILIIASLSIFFKQDEVINLRGEYITDTVIGVVYKMSSFKFISLLISVTLEIYIFICINSLYLKIKEQNNASQIPGHNAVKKQKHQSVKVDYMRSQSLPSYSQALQSHGFIQVAI